MQKFVVISIILMVSIAGAGQTKRAETSLAGIKLGEPLADVRRVLGVPTGVVDTPIKDVAWRAGEREYRFSRGRVVIKVIEGYYQKTGMQSEHLSGVLSVSVQDHGVVDKSIKTGLGLSLGDSVQTIRKLYGIAPQVKQHIQIHCSNGSILDIDLDLQAKVSEIDLSLNQE